MEDGHTSSFVDYLQTLFSHPIKPGISWAYSFTAANSWSAEHALKFHLEKSRQTKFCFLLKY